MLRRSRNRLLSKDMAAQHLEHIETRARGCVIGAETQANAASHYLDYSRDADAVIIKRAVAGRNIAFRVEIDLARAEQNRMRSVDILIKS